MFVILSFFFFNFVVASTLIETETALGIQKKLQETASPAQKKEMLNQVKQKIEAYEKAQQNQDLQALDSQPPDLFKKPKISDTSDETDSSEKLSAEDLEQESKNKETIQQKKSKSVNYTKSAQVFYKKKCLPSRSDCNRGAVLTNIPSVIFDYAVSRGIFEEKPSP